jgi:hypothetical protein
VDSALERHRAASAGAVEQQPCFLIAHLRAAHDETRCSGSARRTLRGDRRQAAERVEWSARSRAARHGAQRSDPRERSDSHRTGSRDRGARCARRARGGGRQSVQHQRAHRDELRQGRAAGALHRASGMRTGELLSSKTRDRESGKR